MFGAWLGQLKLKVAALGHLPRQDLLDLYKILKGSGFRVIQVAKTTDCQIAGSLGQQDLGA